MLTYLEAIFKVLILLQERSVVDDNLCVSNPQLKDLVINCLCRLDRP